MTDLLSVDHGPLVGKLEDDALRHCSDEFSAMVSIAISLKRIADLMDGHPQRTGACDALAMIADRMPSQ
jgi:hypothetical protein